LTWIPCYFFIRIKQLRLTPRHGERGCIEKTAAKNDRGYYYYYCSTIIFG
jgi:hypothetical protein